MNFLLATSNLHKAEEFSQIFDPKIINIDSAKEKINVIEDGTSYAENAFKKAKTYYEKYSTPILSDDSGLNIEAMPDKLGINSARFGGENITFDERMSLILEELNEVQNRNALFSCILCFYVSHEEIFFFEGRLDGEILYSQKGNQGFGYDPIFKPLKHDGPESLAELPEWKQTNSHRAQAAKIAESFFRERVCQTLGF